MDKDTLIFDRTEHDLRNGTDKAYINYWDLNRIEACIKDLSAQLNDYMYCQSTTVKTDWGKQTAISDMTNIPTLEHMERIRDNMQLLIAAFFVYPTTPQLPETFENLTIYTANDIEKILYDLHLMKESMTANFRECNTFYCGEE